jgi:hypothetical protein
MPLYVFPKKQFESTAFLIRPLVILKKEEEITNMLSICSPTQPVKHAIFFSLYPLRAHRYILELFHPYPDIVL